MIRAGIFTLVVLVLSVPVTWPVASQQPQPVLEPVVVEAISGLLAAMEVVMKTGNTDALQELVKTALPRAKEDAARQMLAFAARNAGRANNENAAFIAAVGFGTWPLDVNTPNSAAAAKLLMNNPAAMALFEKLAAENFGSGAAAVVNGLAHQVGAPKLTLSPNTPLIVLPSPSQLPLGSPN